MGMCTTVGDYNSSFALGAVELKMIEIQRKKYNIFLEITTCDLSIYTMDHPKFI